jgi:tetratricopeptide (TPR) repeat protein
VFRAKERPLGMMTDLRGTPISTDDPTLLPIYEQAVREYQSYTGDAVASIDRALALRPDFVSGHLFKACVLMSFGEKRFFEQARTSVAAAEALLERANDRERMCAIACRELVDGDWHAACASFDRVLVEYPRDVVALQTAHLYDFARGDAKNLRDRITRVLPRWSPSVPGYSYVVGLHAFGLEECNQYNEALVQADRALELERTDGWAIHARVHVHEMRGEIDDGIYFLESRERDWANNGFAFHNYWHLALFHFDRGDTRRVLELYDRAIFPDPPSDSSFVLLDASALLWRLRLAGVDVGGRFERLADIWQRKLDGERGFYAFNDVHAMLAFVATRREAAIARVAADLEGSTSGTNAAMAREVGLPIARALVAFGNERYDRCIDELAAVRDHANRFGGSHAQRDLLTLTLIEAALRANRPSVARHYLGERLVQKPGSALGWRQEGRTRGGR